MHRRRLAGVVLALVVVSLVLGIGSGPGDPVASGDPPSDRLVRPAEADSAVWPYTSKRTAVDGRTLALNVLVLDDPDRVKRVLTDRTGVNWSETDVETPLTASPWRPAHGSSRYTYVDPPESDGRWKDADYQLGVGDYLGRQVHVRAYTVPGGRTTALQAHTEYWDWFRLRHTVTGLAPAMSFVERDLRDTPGETVVRREYHGLEGGRADGWISVVDFEGHPASVDDDPATAQPDGLSPLSLWVLVAALPAVALSAVRPGSQRRKTDVVETESDVGERALGLGDHDSNVENRAMGLGGRGAGRDVLLAIGLAGVVVGVRTAGIVVEGLLPAADPKYFSVVLYPLLVLGPLAVVRQFAPGRPPERAAVFAAAGFGAGLVLDFGMVNVAAIPVDVALHRIALVAAIAAVATGASQADRQLTALGVGAWVLVLAAPLAGVI